MASIHHLVHTEASVSDTFEALTTNDGIGRWFTETVCSEWAAEASVRWFADTDLTITALERDERVCLHVHRGSGWEDTDIEFSLEPSSNKTIVRFDHVGWDEVSDHFRDCSMSWAYFLESLCQYLKTGTGTPEGKAPACESG